MMERCLVCNAENKRIICVGCIKLLSKAKVSCSLCGKALQAAALHTDVFAGKRDFLKCGECQKTPPEFEQLIYASYYQYPIDQWVMALKFGNQLAFSRLIADCLMPFLSGLSNTIPLIPVPLHKNRLKTRGYNQAYEIARQISKIKGNPVINNTLIRHKNTAMQAELKESQRAANVRAAFSINQPVNAKQVLLIDDVYTTGHTIKSCAKVLKKAGVEKIIVAVFARSSN